MGKHLRMSEERREAFLTHLRKHGLVIMAAKHASPHSEKGCHVSFYEERAYNPEFAAAWDQALEESEEHLLAELRRRGIDGYEEDVYGNLGDKQGTGIVGRKKVYSDKMAELYARVSSSRVRHGLANRLEVSGSLKHEGSIGVHKLSPESQELLRQLLEREAGTNEQDPSE